MQQLNSATSVRHDDRLETAATAGYRMGMSSSCVIGRRLGRLYDLPSEMPREVSDLLQELERKVGEAG